MLSMLLSGYRGWSEGGATHVPTPPSGAALQQTPTLASSAGCGFKGQIVDFKDYAAGWMTAFYP
jgi:hypothetical protein